MSHHNQFRLFDRTHRERMLKMDAEDEVEQAFSEVSAEELLQSSEDEFVEEVMEEVDIDIPDIDFEDWEARTRGPAGERSLEIPLNYSGDADLLEMSPSGYDGEHYRPRLTARKLTFSFPLEELEEGTTNQEIESRLDEIKGGLEALQDDLNELQDEIRQNIREEYRERKSRAEKNEDKLDELDIPITDREENQSE